MKGMGGHQSAKMLNDEWLTPPWILQKLGTFDLDPCSPIDRPWPTAEKHYTKIDDGLKQDWFGRVWLNAPYSREMPEWLGRLADHGDGIALTFARTETTWFFDKIWERATSLLFMRGRVHFHYVDGTMAKANSGAPSVLVAYGENNDEILRSCGIDGFYMRAKQ